MTYHQQSCRTHTETEITEMKRKNLIICSRTKYDDSVIHFNHHWSLIDAKNLLKAKSVVQLCTYSNKICLRIQTCIHEWTFVNVTHEWVHFSYLCINPHLHMIQGSVFVKKLGSCIPNAYICHSPDWTITIERTLLKTLKMPGSGDKASEG